MYVHVFLITTFPFSTVIHASQYPDCILLSLANIAACSEVIGDHHLGVYHTTKEKSELLYFVLKYGVVNVQLGFITIHLTNA
jgi:hypothetical protein